MFEVVAPARDISFSFIDYRVLSLLLENIINLLENPKSGTGGHVTGGRFKGYGAESSGRRLQQPSFAARCHICVYIHIYIYIYIYMVCMCMYICIHVCTHLCIYTHSTRGLQVMNTKSRGPLWICHSQRKSGGAIWSGMNLISKFFSLFGKRRRERRT